MSYHSVAIEFGWAAAVLGFWATFAQSRRASRRGVEGVSLATWALFVFMGCFWITYGVVARSWEVTMGSAVILPLQLAIVFRLAPWRSWMVVARAFGFFVLLCVVPTVMWGWPAGVYGTGIAMIANRAPQILELIRHEDATGVSVASWLVNGAGSVLWVLYYQDVHLWAAMITMGFAGAANLLIAILATWRHRQIMQRTIAREVFAS